MASDRDYIFSKEVDRLRDGLRGIDQRWQDGLVRNRAGLADKYFGCGLVITGNLDARSEAERGGGSVDINSSSAIFHARVAIFINGVDACNSLQADNKDRQSVLVTNVKLVERPNVVISAAVGLYLIRDEASYPGGSVARTG